MTETILRNFDYNGNLIQKRIDGFVNLTQMCQANGKKISHFLSLKSTKQYIEQIESDDGITASQLLVVKKGNSSDFTQGTWGHPEIAILLAQWISPRFHRWCNAHIFNLMETGQTSLDIDPLEEMRLKIELRKLDADIAKAESEKEKAIANAQNLRYTITQTCPEHIQQKVLGYSEIKTIEYRDRLIKDDSIINDGSTVNKSYLCRKFGFIKNGKPDHKRLNLYLSEMPSEAFELSAYIRESHQFKREYIPMLEQLIEVERQKYIGE